MRKNFKRFLPYKVVVVACNLLLVIIPILTMILLFIVKINSQVRNEVLEMRTVNLEQTQNNIDTTLQNFGSMVLYASMDPDLKPYQLRQSFSVGNFRRK